jgi:membrane protein YdbS with pleckstrin-like domain
VNEEWRGLDGRARWMFHLQAGTQFLFGWVPAVIVASVVAVTVFQVRRVVAVDLGLLGALFLFALWWPSLTFDRFRYLLLEDRLMIHSGVLFRRTVVIPRRRIQHVDIRQGVWEQIFGLARIYVHTASGLGGDGVIPGLSNEIAEEIRDALVHRVGTDDGV